MIVELLGWNRLLGIGLGLTDPDDGRVRWFGGVPGSVRLGQLMRFSGSDASVPAQAAHTAVAQVCLRAAAVR